MYHYLKKHAFAVITACLLLLVNSVLQVLAATKMAVLANYLIAGKIRPFVSMLVMIFLLWFLTFLISFLESYIQETVTQDILGNIRNDIVTSLIKLPQNEFKQNPVDYYESYLQNDVNLIQKEGLNTFFLIVRFSGNAIFALIALYLYSNILFLAAILLVLVIILVPRFCKRFLTAGVTKISQANENFLKFTSSGLHGYDTLYAFNALGEIKKLVATGSQSLKQANVHNTVRRSAVDIITGVINIGSQLLILGITGLLHFQGKISAGAILSTAELATKVFDSAGIINRYFAQLLSTSSIFAKFNELKKQRESKNDNFAKTNFSMEFQSLEFKNVTFSYPNAKEKILHNFSYVFKKGDFYKLNGISGRGKSTLLKLATGQLTPTKGKILLNGINITVIPRNVINSIIIYLPQTVTVFPRSINYNILLGRNYNKASLDRVKQDFEVNENWHYNSLSGGQTQRIALARLIDTKGKLILLDESFSSIDLKTAQNLLQKLLNRVETIIVVSHRSAEVANFSFKNLVLK
ncbi:ABC transporter ATP-binding protein [uncultured Lactobacillus sp.]|uniref:ATP-binding cassette domain-containing protein n=1 Tax=uncultured Lactobacillus sp. TaxID=153152 RepID=UPI0025D0878A|nr:ABC transporter ATP-binding protein [uncultured Lactobacillus sp.]